MELIDSKVKVSKREDEARKKEIEIDIKGGREITDRMCNSFQ